jgi:hypothetical protein
MKTKSNNKKRAALPVLNNGLKLLAATVVAGSLNLQQATAQYTPLRPWEGTIDLFSRNTYHTAATRINVWWPPLFYTTSEKPGYPWVRR